MTPIQVVGIGLDGVAGLSASMQERIEQAAILAGSDRLLNYFPDHPGQRWPLTNLENRLQDHLQNADAALVVVLTSGDPLFFGLGRQLLQALPAEAITFHPHVSSIQLAFSRLKLPWQEAALISAHGRSLAQLERHLKAGANLIAILTDPVHTPGAIAQFMQDLDLPAAYQLWVGENLGGAEEKIQPVSLTDAPRMVFAPLNVVVLQKLEQPPDIGQLPLIGIPDRTFLSFRDRPGLMTKREVRVQILAELALQPHQVVWDIGAGTGSVSVEVARLAPTSQIWAIEKTTAGCHLIRQNASRFATPQINVVQGQAPGVLTELSEPDRIFIGGSSGQLRAILDCGEQRLARGGCMVAALTTLENLAAATDWLAKQSNWQGHFQQIACSRSTTVGTYTRWSPLNPVTLAQFTRQD